MRMRNCSLAVFMTLHHWNLPFNLRCSSFHCNRLMPREKYSQEIILSRNIWLSTCWKLEQRKKKIKWPTSLTCSINLSETPRLGRLYLTSGWIVISLIFQGKVKWHRKLLTLINARNKRFFWEVFPTQNII